MWMYSTTYFLQCGAGSSEADGHVVFVDASLPPWLILYRVARWQFARCVQTYQSQILLNLRVHCTNVLYVEEVHPCNGYSSTNLDRIRLQNSRVFFFSKSV